MAEPIFRYLAITVLTLRSFDNINMTDRQPEDLEEFVSKTQRKKEAHEANTLGGRIVALKKKEFGKLDLPESIYDAIKTAREIHSNGARKRQLQYIAKLLRNEDCTIIEQQLEDILDPGGRSIQSLKIIERWRDKLITEAGPVLQQFIETFPATDKQQLRQLVRNAQKEAVLEGSSKNAKRLFQLIAEQVDGP